MTTYTRQSVRCVRCTDWVRAQHPVVWTEHGPMHPGCAPDEPEEADQ